MTTSAARALHPGIPHDALVFANQPLVAGYVRESTARFGDDKWDLSPVLHQRHQHVLSIDFTTLPIHFRTVTKELFFALLTNDHPQGLEPVRPVTIRGHFSKVKDFLVWADGRGLTTLPAVTAEDLEDYSERLTGLRSTRHDRTAKLGAVRLLWHYRTKLFAPTLPLDPITVWADPTSAAARKISSRTRENRTHRIPEQVLAPLLTWALRWTEEFADDVLRAQEEYLQLRDSSPLAGRGSGHTGHRDRLDKVLDHYRTTKRPLPRRTYAGGRSRLGVNVHFLARKAQVHPSTMVGELCWPLIEKALDELGLDDATYLHTPIRTELDGRPWVGAIGYNTIEMHVRLLQTAAYIVIAFLSGMRDSEVKHMKRGCVNVWRDEDGRAVRHRVTSQAFKGEDTPLGVEATWIVNATVARAVDVLERMHSDAHNMLFTLPAVSRGYKRSGEISASRPAPTVKNPTVTNRDLAEFLQWVNQYCADHGRNDRIPDVNGQEWRLQTRQFRRTLAWFIARQPGGTIAGAIQYRHHSVQMFEGYAGTSSSGFRHEVEAEQAIARGEKLGDLILSPAAGHLTGPAATEAESRLSAFESDVQFLGKVIADEKRLARHMRRHDPHIYPGEFVTCVYNPDRALCRRGDADGPSLPDCQPLKCRNVALTAENASAFLAWLQRMDNALANGILLAPYVRDRMEQRRAELTDFLETNGISASAPQETSQ
ncbi:hypothetical protein [Streptomyces europaeiscabiei]|uniref:hypothetical protein n=1 Tax=Streptomyces europaeiscabiei TaxID=146819 RepID=UPI0029BE0AC9|nr:hypothetical protein [Streptomyces europaeiscabiei]MDX2771946.1 hypothetical protein [Streptomyces europaeiscabiei]